MKLLTLALLLLMSRAASATQGSFFDCSGVSNGQAVSIFTQSQDLSQLEEGVPVQVDGDILVGAIHHNSISIVVDQLSVRNLKPREPKAGSGWADLIVSEVKLSGTIAGSAPLALKCDGHYRARY